jgi:hypothetical protein
MSLTQGERNLRNLATALERDIERFKSRVRVLSYRDVLIAHKPISELAKYAETLGYKYFLWEDRIYQKDENDRWMRTVYTKVNIQ